MCRHRNSIIFQILSYLQIMEQSDRKYVLEKLEEIIEQHEIFEATNTFTTYSKNAVEKINKEDITT